MLVVGEANRCAERARRQVARDVRSVAMVSVDVVKRRDEGGGLREDVGDEAAAPH